MTDTGESSHKTWWFDSLCYCASEKGSNNTKTVILQCAIIIMASKTLFLEYFITIMPIAICEPQKNKARSLAKFESITTIRMHELRNVAFVGRSRGQWLTYAVVH